MLVQRQDTGPGYRAAAAAIERWSPRHPADSLRPRGPAAVESSSAGTAAQTRTILEMLSVLNLRMPLAQLGQAAQVESPSAAIEPAVASGLVDWRPEEPACPVVIRYPLVRDAVYAGITATRRRVLHARAASAVSESASWEHRVAALDPAGTRSWPPSWSGWRARRRPAAAWRWPPPTCSGPRTSPRPGPTGSGGC